MFGIDFSELVVCAIVALVVVGPQRLPEAVRTGSLWIGRLKRSLRETQTSIEQQIGMEEIRRQLHTEEMMRTLDSMKEEIDSALYYDRISNKPELIDQLPAPASAANRNIPADNKTREAQASEELPLSPPAQNSQPEIHSDLRHYH
ncbi:MAG TPA: Sec-independent protein translocase protein TatB [Cellvibrio sp.]|nr:Sec-independent protein translocase protein TatB [Cellvibrio sp.]